MMMPNCVTPIGLTHLKYKIKCNRRCGQICILDRWRSNAIGFSFNCVSPRLKCLQRRVTRKIKGSKNRRKAIHKLAKIHELITNQRHDFQHKVSLNLICENQAIAVETLNVQGMKKNHKLAQAISDSAWNSFLLKLTYKAERFGKTVIKIGMFEPSSKTCNICGYKNKELTLKDREWPVSYTHLRAH